MPNKKKFEKVETMRKILNFLGYYIRTIPIWLVYMGLSLPAMIMFGLGLADRLGADPLDRLIAFYGEWGLKLMMVTLMISPLRAWGLDLLKFRRAIGVMGFVYITLHLIMWLAFDQLLNMESIITEIIKRPFITFGMLGFLLMVPMAITSNQKMLKKLGFKKWKRLHRLNYGLAVIAIVHYLMVVKGWQIEPMMYGVVVMLLLLWRLRQRRG